MNIWILFKQPLRAVYAQTWIGFVIRLLAEFYPRDRKYWADIRFQRVVLQTVVRGMEFSCWMRRSKNQIYPLTNFLANSDLYCMNFNRGGEHPNRQHLTCCFSMYKYFYKFFKINKSLFVSNIYVLVKLIVPFPLQIKLEMRNFTNLNLRRTIYWLGLPSWIILRYSRSAWQGAVNLRICNF